MSKLFKPRKLPDRYCPARLGTALFLVSLPQYLPADTTSEWLATTGGNWTTAAAWSTSPYYPNNGTPTAAQYDAVFDLAGSGAYTATLNSSISINELTLNAAHATLSHIAGTLTVPALNLDAGYYALSGGTLSGGTNGGTVALTGGQLELYSGKLDNLTVTGGNLSFGGSLATLSISDGLSLSGNTLTFNGRSSKIYLDGGNQTLDNITINQTTSGTIYAGGATSSGTVSVTLGTHAILNGVVTLSSYSSSDSLVNKGLIENSGSSQTVAIGTAGFTNNGSVEGTSTSTVNITSTNWTNASTGMISVDASTLNLSGTWSNSGTISGSDGATISMAGTWTSTGKVNLSGGSTLSLAATTFTPSAIGNITSDSTSVVDIRGTMNDAGVKFTPSVPVAVVYGGAIENGSLGGTLALAGGILSGVTITSSATVNASGSYPTIEGAWSNQGVVNVPSGVTLYLAGTYTPASIGTINNSGSVYLEGTMNNAGVNFILPQGYYLDGTITGGTIASNTAVVGETFNGVNIAQGATVSTIEGSIPQVVCEGSWTNYGTLFTDNSNAFYEGTWSNQGTITNNSSGAGLGQSLYEGIWNNSGTINFGAYANATFEGTWNNSGTIALANLATLTLSTNNVTRAEVGTVNAASGSTIIISSATLSMASTDVFSTNATIELTNYGEISGGTVNLAAGQTLNILTLGILDGVTLRGGNIATLFNTSGANAIQVRDGLNLGGII
jgi:hypothetical protein